MGQYLLQQYFATKARKIIAVAFMALGLSLFYPVDLTKFLAESPTMYDRHGELIHIERNQFDTWMLQTQTIPPMLTKLLLSFEDKAFYFHPGFNPFSLARASWQAILHRKIVSGGSTLTMQVARLLNPGSRTIWRKLIEIHTALRLTSQFSKEMVLKIYLTLAPYGGNIQGIRAASWYYFGKEPNCLPLSYQAMLVAIPQAPSHLRPDRFINKTNLAKNKVLQRLPQSDVSIQEALQEVCAITPTPFIKLAPHGFIAQRRGQIKANCLDKAHQIAVTSLVSDFVQKLPIPMNAAAIVYSLKSNEILVYIGGTGETNRMNGNDMCQSKRSPGSSLKPFIYGLAMERGYLNPHTIVTDKPINLKGYQPENFDLQFNGEMSIEEALQQSLNTPVVQVLNQIGPGYFLGWLKRHQATIHLPKGHQPGLAIGLGGLGISLIDLVQLYSLLASGKLFTSLAQPWISNTLLQAPMPDQRQNNPGIAYKTGTSYGYRDSWSIGYDNDHVVGVWVGRADGTPCPGYHGFQIAAPLMVQIFYHLKVSTLLTHHALSDPLNANPTQRLRFIESARPEFKITMPKTNTTVCVSANQEIYLQTNSHEPVHWYINGKYLNEPAQEGVYHWQPNSSGFYQITAVNHQNHLAVCDVKVIQDTSLK